MAGMNMDPVVSQAAELLHSNNMPPASDIRSVSHKVIGTRKLETKTCIIEMIHLHGRSSSFRRQNDGGHWN